MVVGGEEHVKARVLGGGDDLVRAVEIGIALVGLGRTGQGGFQVRHSVVGFLGVGLQILENEVEIIAVASLGRGDDGLVHQHVSRGGDGGGSNHMLRLGHGGFRWGLCCLCCGRCVLGGQGIAPGLDGIGQCVIPAAQDFPGGKAQACQQQKNEKNQKNRKQGIGFPALGIGAVSGGLAAGAPGLGLLGLPGLGGRIPPGPAPGGLKFSGHGKTSFWWKMVCILWVSNGWDRPADTGRWTLSARRCGRPGELGG